MAGRPIAPAISASHSTATIRALAGWSGWSPGGAGRWRLPYGDQGLLIHRDLLRTVGGDRAAAADGGRGPGPPPRAPPAGGAGQRRGDLGGEVASARAGTAARLRNLCCLSLYFGRRAAAPDRAALFMKDTVFVFARAPRLGAVKRRLAREIGDRAALRFHRRDAAPLLRALAADRRFAHRPRGDAGSRAFSPAGARGRVGQGRGDLGPRMARGASAWSGGGSSAATFPMRERPMCGRLRRPRPRRRGVRSGGGRRLLAGGAVPAPPGAAVRRRALVHRTRARRHAGEFSWPPRCVPAHAARCGHRGGLAPCHVRSVARQFSKSVTRMS